MNIVYHKKDHLVPVYQCKTCRHLAISLYAELLLLHNTGERLSSSLSGAAYRLRNMNEPVILLSKEELAKVFRPEITGIIGGLKSNESIGALDELIQLTPSGLFEMMRIHGLGGKKLSLLSKTAGIDGIDALLEACKNDKISRIAGFGAKTQQNIIKAIEAYRSNEDRFHYATVADIAEALVQKLQQVFKTKQLSLCGEVRRQATTVAGIEIITVIPAEKHNDKELRSIMVIQSSNKEQTTGHTLDEIPVSIYHTAKKLFYSELFKRTGNEGHVKKVLDKISSKAVCTSEEDIYKEAGLHYIPPEMREDVAEWNFTKKAGSLITLEDIKGVVHNHTDWSDGIDKLPDFVKACSHRGYEYVVISDHSKNAHYAGGLKEDKVLKQLEEIDKLNKMLAPFRIFKSIECDILIPGELDYSSDILQLFDLVIISVHQSLKMNEEKATKRLIKAIENPYTTILGHMTGRQLLIRPGYPVNFTKVIDACAANNVVIEINANPYRLDMDWSHIPYALSKGVMISINPDAHSIGEIENIRWGVSAARKGGLTKDMTWNAMPLKGIEQWLRKKTDGS
ncbi:MAG: helix-hairpin-helix domain-containing protein [Ginsengibacter sp.]